MDPTWECPVCGADQANARVLASHLVAEADRSDGRHIMWLNRHVTKLRVGADELADLLVAGPGPGSSRVRR